MQMPGLHPSLRNNGTMPSETVILVHCLRMAGMELALLKWRFEIHHVYHCILFSYASVT